MHNNTWIRDLDHRTGFTTDLFMQFAIPWNLIRHVRLETHQEDTITWKFTPSGAYTAASAYRAQFLGCVKAPSIGSIWKTWAPPKCKFFAWLITQDRVWTSDRLAHRGWDHRPSCPLCRTTVETSLHLTSECRYTWRIWDLITTWTAQPGLRPSNWRPSNTTLEWWNNITTTPAIQRKAMRTLTMLILWEIWKERNSRVFQRQESSALSLFAKIKNKATAWTQAGASRFASFLMRE